MTLIQAWKDSLALCKLMTLKMMFLVTLNTMKEVLRVLCTPWFFITVGILLLGAFFVNSLVFISLAYMFISVFILLAARPSLRLKDRAYFKEYLFLYTKFLVIATLLVFLLCIIMLILFKIWLTFLWWIGKISVNQNGYYTGPLSILNIFNQNDDLLTWIPIVVVMIPVASYGLLGIVEYTTFFYLDRVGSVLSSFKKAVVFITYNIPMLLVYVSMALCIKWVYWLLVTSVFGLLWGTSCSIGTSFFAACAGVRYSLLGLLPYLFSLCLFVNIYTKRIHDQYSLYQ